MSEKNGTTVPGIAATRKWLEENGIKPYRFALDNGIDPSGFGRLLKDDTAVPSVETATKIERGTKGAVTVAMFVPVKEGES